MDRFKRLLPYYRPYRLRFAAVLACALIAAAAGLVFPLLVRRVTDGVLGGGVSVNEILIPALLMLVAGLIEAAAGSYFDYFGHCVGADIENDLRCGLFAHLERLSFSFFDSHRVGEIMSSLTNDLEGLSELCHHGPEDYIVNSIKFIGASVILFSIDWRLSLCMYAFLPVMAYLTIRLNRKVRANSEANRAHIADINARAEDAISGIRVSQAFCRGDFEINLFKAAGARFTRSRKSIYLAESIEYQTLTLLTRFMYIAVTAIGAWRISKGSSPADLIAFILYISYLTEPVRSLAWMTTQFQQGLAGFDRVTKILDTAPDIADRPDAVTFPGGDIDISFENVTFRYSANTAPVLRDVSFSVPAGEKIAIVGVSGAGKSTLCALLSRFYEPEQGRITAKGRDISSYTLDSLRGAVSPVEQSTFLFAGSVIDNIRYADPDADIAAVENAARLADADDFIRALPEGYKTDIGPRGVRLSGGQRQRIAIARAFLRNAPILVLDEATSALDPLSEKAIHGALDRLSAGRTTVMIAHRLSTIMKADRIVVIRDGKVAEEGTFEELASHGGAFVDLYPEATENILK